MRILLIVINSVLVSSRIYAADGFDQTEFPLLFLGNHSLPPMIFLENNKPTGVVVDLAGALSQRMKRPVKFRYMNWTTAQQLVLDGRADALLQINPTDKRRKLYDFSDFLLESEFSVFIRFDKEQIYKVTDLKGLKVGVEERGMPAEILNQNPSINLVVIPDIVKGMRLLTEGAIDAVVADQWVGLFVLAENHIRGIRVSGEAVAKSRSAIAVKKGNSSLMSEINQALAAIKSDGTYERILSKWKPQEVIFQTKAQYYKRIGILISILCMFTLALIWGIFLISEINKRKRAEKQLASEKHLQKLLLDHFPGVMLLLRTTTREVVASNQAGSNVGAVCGSKCYETWGKSPYPCTWCLAPDLWATGKEKHTVIEADGKAFEAHWASVSDDLYLHYALDVTEHRRAEEKLLEKERLIQQALRISRSFTFDWDVATDRVYRSDSCRRIFGVDSGEIFNATSELFSQHVHPDDLHRFQKLLHNLTPAKDTYVMDYRLVLSNGSVVTLEETARGFFDDNGRTKRVIGVATDVTERKKAEDALHASEARFRGYFELGLIGMAVTSPSRSFFEVNEEMCRILGYKRNELLQMTWAELTHPDDLAGDIAQFNRAIAGEIDGYSLDKRFICKGGRIIDTTISIKCLRRANGSADHFVALIQDITERKGAERELFFINKTLEERVAERTAEAEQRALQLRKLTTELTLAEQRERQRISFVLHDGLQQILVAAKFQVALLNKTRDLPGIASDLAELIDEGIKTSRSLTAELSPPILQQGGLVPAVEWLGRWMHDKQGLTVKIVSHNKIESAPEEVVILLFQSIRELLFNVAKHSGIRTARVELRMEAGRIRVDVEDEGAGFDPAQLNGKDNKSRGLGLFSIKERLSYLGGSVEIDSAAGRGSRFRLISPLISEKQAVSQAGGQPIVSIAVASQRTAASDPEKRIRLILVDDHLVMRQGLASLLKAEPDLEIIGEASDGQSGVELIRELRPDVVLMDISMPGMDGIQATRIIHKELPEVRVIGLSMFQEEEQQAEMTEAGAVFYLTKTGPSSQLINAIRKCKVYRPPLH